MTLMLYVTLAGLCFHALRRESAYVARLRPDTVLRFVIDTAKWDAAMTPQVSEMPDRPSIVALAQAHTERLAAEYEQAVVEAFRGHEATLWVEDETWDLEPIARTDVVAIQNQINAWAWTTATAGWASPDETGGMTLDELLGDIDTLIGDGS